jgi:hypothetical protein
VCWCDWTGAGAVLVVGTVIGEELSGNVFLARNQNHGFINGFSTVP